MFQPSPSPPAPLPQGEGGPEGPGEGANLHQEARDRNFSFDVYINKNNDSERDREGRVVARNADHSHCLFFALPITTAGGQQGSNSDRRLEQLYSQAKTAQEAGDYRTAARNYTEILKLRPGLGEIHANLGLMQHLQGEYAEAVKSFTAALRVKPQLFAPNLLLGLDLLKLREPQRAITYLQRAQQLNSKDVQSALGLGQAYADLHEFGQANRWYRRAAEIDPANVDALYGQGITYLNVARSAGRQIEEVGRGSAYARILYAESLEGRGAIHDAVRVYEKLVAMPTAPPWAHAALGFAYLVQGDPSGVPEAGKQFAEALGGDPECLLAQLGIARLDLQGGDTSSALGQVTKVWNADANFVKVHAHRLWQGWDAQKVAELEKALKHMPAEVADPALVRFLTIAIERWRQEAADTFVWTVAPADGSPRGQETSLPGEGNLAAVQQSSNGQYTSCAQKLKRKGRGLPPADLTLLAECAYNSGDFRSSFEAGEELLRANPRSLPGLYWQARMGQKLGIISLIRVGLAEPHSPRMHILLGEVYQEKNNTREAEAAYKKAIELDPQSVPGRLGLGMVYWNSGQSDKAVPELEKVLAARPGDAQASYAMGAILVEQEKYEEAMPYLAAALGGTISILPHVHALRGRVLTERGQLAEAVAEMKQALDRDPDGTYHFQLSTLLRKLGDEHAAKTALRESERIRAARREGVETPDPAR